MAGLPKIRRILKEDLREAPSWFSKLLDPINTFMDSVYNAMNKNQTFGENVKGQIKSFQVTAGAGAVNNTFFFTTTVSNPAGVILIRAIQNGSTFVPLTSAPTIASWRHGDGMIYVDSITGLTAGQKYTITILVI
jgi:hypothetical protein